MVWNQAKSWLMLAVEAAEVILSLWQQFSSYVDKIKFTESEESGSGYVV